MKDGDTSPGNMASRKFCDLCGEPALESGFASKRIKPDENKIGFHVTAEFVHAERYYPTTNDQRGDICGACLARELRSLADAIYIHPPNVVAIPEIAN
jgi:hypothetical protein